MTWFRLLLFFIVFSQFSTVLRCSWTLREAVVGSVWVGSCIVRECAHRCVPGEEILKLWLGVGSYSAIMCAL